MLVVALAATLLGFAFLVLALVTGVLWLAVACIVICAIGSLFLLADTVGVGLPGRRRRAATRTPDTEAADPGQSPVDQTDAVAAPAPDSDDGVAQRHEGRQADGHQGRQADGRHGRADEDDATPTAPDPEAAPGGESAYLGRHERPHVGRHERADPD